MRRIPPGIALVAALALTACESNDIKPSPIPANAMVVPLGGPGPGDSRAPLDEDEGVRVDEVLAVVEGEPLTLRTLLRRLGIDPEELDDEANQREIMTETMAWAKERVFVKAAERAGLTLSPPRVDAYVETKLEEALAEESERVGTIVTREEYLESEGVVWEEYRTRAASELLRSLYLQMLLRGVGGPTRPQIDMTVSPAEVRRIYANHRTLFDVSAGVRIAQFRIAFDRFEQEGRDFFEVDELTTRQATGLATDFQRGVAPASIAEKYDLGEEGESWNAAKEDQFLTEMPDPTMREWLFDPARKPLDTKIVPVPTGMIVFGVLEQQQARQVPFKEAYPKIVKEIQLGRMLRLENMTLIDLVTKGNVVWPDELADALLAEAQMALTEIGNRDVWKGARLR